MTGGHDFTGLPFLADGIRGYFAAMGITAPVFLGWPDRTEQINQGPGGANRVVIVPGDDSGNAGELADPKYPGVGQGSNGAPLGRPLNNWIESALLSVWAVDTKNPRDSQLQYIATRALFMQTVRAIRFTARADAKLGRLKWTVSPVEKSFGRELVCSLTYNSPIIDVAAPVVVPIATNQHARDVLT
jgi:hypothetical protein